MTEHNSELPKKVVVVSADKQLVEALTSKQVNILEHQLSVLAEPISNVWQNILAENLAGLVIDLGEITLENMEAFQRVKRAIAAEIPVIVIVDSYDNAVVRMLVQMQVSDFLVKPITPQELVQSCADTLKSNSAEKRDDAEIITFFPASGGVGNTVLALQTAFIKHLSRRATELVCVVDLNFQTGACTEYLDLEPRFMFEDIENDIERLDRQLLDTMLSKHESGLSVLAAPNSISEQRSFSPEIVIQLLELVSSHFDTVIIDMPRIWMPWTETVLRGTDQIYVVAEATVPCLRQAQRLIKGIHTETNNEARPQVIINRYQSNGKTAVQRKHMEDVLGEAFAGTVSNDYTLVCNAIDVGVPVHELNADADLIKDLRKIVMPDDAGDLLKNETFLSRFGTKLKRIAG